MAVGMDFYKNSVDLINRYKTKNIPVSNQIQTNGVLVNDKWAKFFIDNNFDVSVSIDGPKFLHDLNRKNWSGDGSFEKTLRGYKILKENGISPGVLTVLTFEHLSYAKELFEFYLDNEITYVGFNTEEIVNFNQSSSLGNIKNLHNEKYISFMKEIFDLSIKYSEKIQIREIFNSINLLYIRKKDSNYNYHLPETVDLGIITIQKNGDISTYCPEFAGMKSHEYNNFIIGNILKLDKLSDVEKNPNYLKIKKDYDIRKKTCKKTCEYYSLCGSAYLSKVFTETKSLTNTECSACVLQRQSLIDTVLDKLAQYS